MRLLLALVTTAGMVPTVAEARYQPPAVMAPPPQPVGQPPPAPAPPPEPLRPAVLSAMITPFALPWEIFELTTGLFPIVAMSLELRAHPRLGIAVMGLAGDETDTYQRTKSRYTFVEGAFEPRWYAQGGFRGAMVGAALHYFRLHADIDLSGPAPLPFEFAGYTYGGFVGYKYTARIGFTFEVKLGLEVVDRTLSDAGSHPDVLPITDAKVGWSF